MEDLLFCIIVRFFSFPLLTSRLICYIMYNRIIIIVDSILF